MEEAPRVPGESIKAMGKREHTLFIIFYHVFTDKPRPTPDRNVS